MSWDEFPSADNTNLFLVDPPVFAGKCDSALD
jgi:hypothetical protein